jgi:hypothetical protein
MFAATGFDNLLVLLFFGMAIFFQLLTAATKKRKRSGDAPPRSTSPSQTTRPLETEDEETDEERIRKFLEALGQPTDAKPPPPVARRPTYQKPIVAQAELLKRRWVSTPLPPLTTQPPDLPPEISRPIPVAPKSARKLFKPRAAEPSTFEVQQAPPRVREAEVKSASQPAAAQTAAKRVDISTLLRSTSGLRNAMILREIFGPPRSMQPLDPVGNF